MERVIYGNLGKSGVEVVVREGRYFVRYDAGAHVIAWREDEITQAELDFLRLGRDAEHKALLQIQARLEREGKNPYVQNWAPA